MAVFLRRTVSRRELFGLASAPNRAYALVDSSCLTFNQVACESCAEVCDRDAIRFARTGAVKQPTIDLTQCTACEACIPRCPVGAISLVRPDQE